MLLKKFGALLLTAAILLVPVTMFASPVKASPDGDFLAQMHSRGIQSVDGDSALIELAHAICEARYEGLSEQQVIDMLTPRARNGVGPADVQFIVQQSEAAYCPTGTPARSAQVLV